MKCKLFFKECKTFSLRFKKHLPHLVQGNCEKGKYEESFKIFVHGDILKKFCLCD